jgi:protein-disulfide isomerase-like protein with CxxC motif
MGVHGFPTVLVRDDRGFALLTNGYQPIEALEEPLANWIASSARTDQSA